MNTGSWIKHHIVLSIIALILGFLTIRGVFGAIQSGGPITLKEIVLSAVSQNVRRDTHGNTNILLLGVGGEGHDGSNLTDTMIIASVDAKNKSVAMLSVPRDLYVNNPEVGWGSRMNSIYQLILDKTGDNKEKAMKALLEQVETIFDLEIQYYAKVDFTGFVEVVDALGGVTVNLDEALIDPFYPGPDGSLQLYDPLYIGAGERVLDGETALKYARSRETTSDFDRAKRQQEVLVAMKEQAMQIGFLLNPFKLKNLYKAVSNNFESNMTVSEILYMGKLAEGFDADSISHVVFNDLAYESGGFLFTPDRNLYGGAFVLTPISGDFSELNLFAQIFLFNQEAYQNQTPISIYNGTSIEGLAVDVKLFLKRYGFNVVEHGNSLNKPVEVTNVSGSDDATLDLLEEILPGEYSGNGEEDKIVIELGEDFIDFYKDNSAKFYDFNYYQ
ncbi:LCP family protein [Candidatus Peregrinibacteria bacterium]|nr:LCP family protein [Candidatus Peregrinibacteria bacterium]